MMLRELERKEAEDEYATAMEEAAAEEAAEKAAAAEEAAAQRARIRDQRAAAAGKRTAEMALLEEGLDMGGYDHEREQQRDDDEFRDRL